MHPPEGQVAHDVSEARAVVDDRVDQRCAPVKVGPRQRVREVAAHVLEAHDARDSGISVDAMRPVLHDQLVEAVPVCQLRKQAQYEAMQARLKQVSH